MLICMNAKFYLLRMNTISADSTIKDQENKESVPELRFAKPVKEHTRIFR